MNYRIKRFLIDNLDIKDILADIAQKRSFDSELREKACIKSGGHYLNKTCTCSLCDAVMRKKGHSIANCGKKHVLKAADIILIKHVHAACAMLSCTNGTMKKPVNAVEVCILKEKTCVIT